MKEAPFYIGQKVVCLKGIANYHGQKYETGKVYVITMVEQCPGCGLWHIATGYKAMGLISNCVMCPTPIGNNKEALVRASRFAPVEENSYEDVTKELAKLPQDEVPDVKQIKELVN